MKLDLKFAAEQEAERVSRLVCPGKNSHTRAFVKTAFVSGALWQHERVWHKASACPEEGRLVLAVRGYSGLVCGPNHEGWSDTVKMLGFKSWAYIDELVGCEQTSSGEPKALEEEQL